MSRVVVISSGGDKVGEILEWVWLGDCWKEGHWVPVTFRSQDWSSRILDAWDYLCNVGTSVNIPEIIFLVMVQQDLFGQEYCSSCHSCITNIPTTYWFNIRFAHKYTICAVLMFALLCVTWGNLNAGSWNHMKALFHIWQLILGRLKYLSATITGALCIALSLCIFYIKSLQHRQFHTFYLSAPKTCIQERRARWDLISFFELASKSMQCHCAICSLLR